MATPLSYREEAEAIEEFGFDLDQLIRNFDRLCERMSPGAISELNTIPHQEHLSEIARRFRELGDRLCRECDEAAEERDRLSMISVGGHRDGGSAS